MSQNTSDLKSLNIFSQMRKRQTVKIMLSCMIFKVLWLIAYWQRPFKSSKLFFKPNQKLGHTFALVSLDHPVVKIGQAGEAGASKPMKTNTTVRAKCRIGVGLSVGLGVWNTPFSKDLLKASVKLFYTFSYSRKRTLLASTYSYTVICILIKWNCCTIELHYFSIIYLQTNNV